MCEDNIWKEAIYMFGRREKEYYEIAPKQLEEIRQFYKKLGAEQETSHIYFEFSKQHMQQLDAEQEPTEQKE